jgi:hypothetical protein
VSAGEESLVLPGTGRTKTDIKNRAIKNQPPDANSAAGGFHFIIAMFTDTALNNTVFIYSLFNMRIF